jgi:peptide/nickel transport system ATP-binding protein
MTAFIRLDDITRRFTSVPPLTERLAKRLTGSAASPTVVHAVEGVSLAVAQGETLGLVGESGCGKSTLGRVAAGILQASFGQASVAGEPVMTGKRKTSTRIQMVFQDPYASLNPRMRVGETIAEGPLAHKLVTPAQSAADVTHWLEAVGLDAAAAQRFPHQFSGGQRQRVAIARALVADPLIVIADEPTANLDAHTGQQVIALMRELNHSQGVTFVFSTHDPRLIDAVDRLIRLADGQIEAASQGVPA